VSVRSVVRAGLLVVVALGTACSRPADDGLAGRVLPGGSAGPGTPADAPVLPAGGDFTLTGPGGTPFSLAAHRGGPIVLFFGFASCPDFCPRAMGTVKAALATLEPAERERVLTVFVSVDPERDTPASLERYLAQFGVRAVGVTGTHAQLTEAIGRYAGAYERVGPAGQADYMVMHPTSLYVLDGRGTLRAMIGNVEPPSALATALRQAASS
jgi:protein SCO1